MEKKVIVKVLDLKPTDLSSELYETINLEGLNDLKEMVYTKEGYRDLVRAVMKIRTFEGGMACMLEEGLPEEAIESMIRWGIIE
jgi:hypothetical protein